MAHWKMQFNVAGCSDRVECFDFEMIIDNLSKLDDALSSPMFITTSECQTTWQIKLGVTMGSRKIRVGLKRTDSNTCCIKASMFYEIQNGDCEVYHRDYMEHVYNTKSAEDFYCDDLDMPSQVQYIDVKGGKKFKLSSDKIIIKGLVLMKEREYFCENHKMEHILNAACMGDLKGDYKHLYNSQQYSDIEFHFPDGKLRAHKNILSSRSSVLKHLLDQNQCKKSIIMIVDVEKSVFDALLLFLYIGAVETRNIDIILPLYAVAYRYEVYKLAKICASFLALEMSVKTVAHILESAKKFCDTQLKDVAIDYVSKNFVEFSQTSEWGNLIDSDPRFASTILRKASENLVNCK